MRLQKVELNEFQLQIKNQLTESLKRYRQGALHLATGLGKSYIVKSIIDDLLEEDNNAEILWLSKSSDCTNVANNVFNISSKDNESSKIYRNITFLGFELLRTEAKFIDNINFSNLKLIIIDEAHSALAEETYKSISYLKSKLYDKVGKRSRPGLIVMTASAIRSCDQKHVFDTLVPELKAGIDYENVGLEKALDLGLIGKVIFLNNNLYKYELMARTVINQINEVADNAIFKSKQKEMSAFLKFVQAYKNDMAYYLGNDIQEHIKKYYDAKDGDQWVVFYSTTEEAMNSERFLIKLFTNIYKHNTKVKINVYQYHNLMSDAENNIVNKKMYAIPNKNTVNVYVTVNKGSQSIHPAHVAGEIQFRGTSSLNFYEQAIGRVTKAQEYMDKPVFVVDIAGNSEKVKNGATINYGLQKAEDRIGKSIADDIELEEKLRNIYFDNIDFSTTNSKFDDIVKEYNELMGISYIERMTRKVANVLRKEVGDTFKYEINYSPFAVIRHALDKDEADELCGWLTNIQHRFINGDFGRYTIDDEEVSEVYRLIRSLIGDVIFVNQTSINVKTDFKELRSIAIAVKEKNYDKNRIKRTKWLSEKINKYRDALIKNTLPVTVVEYCNYYNINIYGDDEELVNNSIEQSKLTESIKKEMKLLQKRLRTAEGTRDIQDLIKAYAMYMYISNKYNVNSNEYCISILKAMNTTYTCLRDVNKINGVKAAEQISVALSSIIKLDKIESDCYDIRKCHIDNRNADTVIIHMARRISQRQKLTDMEVEVLNIYNINANSSRVNVESDKLMKYTNISNILARLDMDYYSFSEKERIASKLSDVVVATLPSTWGKAVKEAKEKYLADNDIEPDKDEMLMACRCKINTLDELSDDNKKAIASIESTFKTAIKHLTIGEILSTCFIVSCQDDVAKAIDNVAQGKADEDDIIVINYAIKNSDNCDSKIMFIRKNVFKDNKYNDLTESLIKKQIIV